MAGGLPAAEQILARLADVPAMLPTLVFEHPQWLWLVPPLLALVWWIGRRSLSLSHGTRGAMVTLLRSLVILFVCMALAEPRINRTAKDVAVVAVLDVSASVPDGERRLAEAFLAGSILKRDKGDRFGLVTVARRAMVHSLPTAQPPAQPNADMGYLGHADATDLQSGIELARALLPSDAAGRVLLISDGNQTRGDLESATRMLTAQGIPLDVASVRYDRSAAPRIEKLITPTWARDEGDVNVRIVMNSGAPATGRLSLVINGDVVDLAPDDPATISRHIALAGGTQVLGTNITLPPGVVHTMEAVFEPDDRTSAIPDLQRAKAVTFTSGKARVLVLAEDHDAAQPFLAAIADDETTITVKHGTEAPVGLAEWAGYDCVVLFDEEAGWFSQEQQENMRRYVVDAGGGLIVVGGPNSFGAGGWIGSPLADALPLLLDPPQKREMPKGALAIIIDQSGSMAEAVSDTGVSQQQLANEAAILGVRALSRLDEVTIIAFSDESRVVVPLTSVRDPDMIARHIRSIGPTGGTNMFPALALAGSELAKSAAGVKHVIVLTDGQTIGDPGEGRRHVAEMKKRGITLSTVGIGDMSNDSLLMELAKRADGRFYPVKSQNAKALLPQIFIKEARVVKRSLIWEGTPFSPKIAAANESLRGLRGFPGISGYIVTAERGGLANVALRGPEGDPILASWQHGLGRVTAYTSDAAPRWNAAWTGWDGYRAFWRQQKRWTSRAMGDPNARLSIESKGDVSKYVLELFDAQGDRANFAAVRGRVVSDAPGAKGRDLTLRQTGPGRYEGTIENGEGSTDLAFVRYQLPASGASDNAEGAVGRAGQVRAAAVRSSGDEMRVPTPSTNLLWNLAKESNGRIYRLDPAGEHLWVRDHLKMPVSSKPIWLVVAMLACATMLLDVAARRLTLDWAKMTGQAKGLFQPAKAAAHASMATLGTVKAKTDAAMRARSQVGSQAGTKFEADQSVHGPRDVAVERPKEEPVLRGGSSATKRSVISTTPTGDEANVMARLQQAKRRSRGDA